MMLGGQDSEAHRDALKRARPPADTSLVPFSSLQEYVDYWYGARNEALRDLVRRFPSERRVVDDQAELDAVTDWRKLVELVGRGRSYELSLTQPRRRRVRLELAPEGELRLYSVIPTDVHVYEDSVLTGEVVDLYAHTHGGRIEVQPVRDFTAIRRHIFLHAVGRRARVEASDAEVYLSAGSVGRVHLRSVAKVFDSSRVTVSGVSWAEVYGRGHVTLGTRHPVELPLDYARPSPAAVFHDRGWLKIKQNSAPSAIVLHADDVKVDCPEMPHEWWEESWQLTERFLAENPPPFPDKLVMERLDALRDEHDPLYRHVAAGASFDPLKSPTLRPRLSV
jgi:hypothetical protein